MEQFFLREDYVKEKAKRRTIRICQDLDTASSGIKKDTVGNFPDVISFEINRIKQEFVRVTGGHFEMLRADNNPISRVLKNVDWVYLRKLPLVENMGIVFINGANAYSSGIDLDPIVPGVQNCVEEVAVESADTDNYKSIVLGNKNDSNGLVFQKTVLEIDNESAVYIPVGSLSFFGT
jgi:hypothetical protein